MESNVTSSPLVEDAIWNMSIMVAARVIVFVPLVLFTLAANIAIIYLMAFDVGAKTGESIFYISMATADLFWGPINYTLTAFYGARRTPAGRHICMLWCILDCACGTIVLGHLIALAAYRLMKLRGHGNFNIVAAEKNNKTICICIWMMSLVLWTTFYIVINVSSKICNFHENKWLTAIYMICLCILPLLGVLAINIFIIILLNKNKTNNPATTTAPTPATAATTIATNGTDTRNVQELSEKREILILIICSISFAICWIPVTIIWILDGIFQIELSYWMAFIVLVLYYLYSTVQPMFIFSSHPYLRHRLREILCSRDQIHPTSSERPSHFHPRMFKHRNSDA